jgi:hypothetical protein
MKKVLDIDTQRWNIKLFTVAKNSVPLAGAFANISYLHPNIIFEGKAKSQPLRGDTQAYFNTEFIMTVKILITHAPGSNCKKIPTVTYQCL